MKFIVTGARDPELGRPIYTCFVCLLFLKIFHSFGKVIIAGKALKILILNAYGH